MWSWNGDEDKQKNPNGEAHVDEELGGVEDQAVPFASEEDPVESSDEEEGTSGDEHDEHHDELGPLNTDNVVEVGEEDPLSSGYLVSEGKRTSTATDLATGKKGGARAHHALLRSESSVVPRCGTDRLKHNIFGRVWGTLTRGNSKRPINKEKEDDSNLRSSIHGRLMVSERHISNHVPEFEGESGDLESPSKDVPQYRLEAVAVSKQVSAKTQTNLQTLTLVKPPSRGSRWFDMWGTRAAAALVYDDTSSSRSSRGCFGFSPNGLVIQYLHWTFRSSFFAFFLSAACAFFGLCTLFAIGIWAIGHRHPSCIGGPEFNPEFFIDAFELSWTTFSTVGYGLVYAGISYDEPNIRKCTGITILVSLEAYVGVLFASLCGAILFAKVSRIQSYAQVVFSDPIVIRYGCGLGHEAYDASSDGDSTTTGGDEPEHTPCPMLEFRVVNRMSSVPGGEIIDATMNIVASIDASQACAAVRRSTMRRRRGKKGKKGGPRARGSAQRKSSQTSSTLPKLPENETRLSRADSAGSLGSLFDAIARRQTTSQSFEEDPSGHLVPKRIFAKLDVESQDHPFFKRIWIVRHRLDEESPLLKSHARKMVQRAGGFWPKELNNHEGVRAAVLFEQILVSLSGTSNADANSVYAQKVYDFADVNVGYRFVNMLYRDKDDGSLQVDMRLLNDVQEQNGGGGEPLVCTERGFTDIIAM